MELTWLGHACFRLRGRDALVLTDPPEPAFGYVLGRLAPTIITISHAHAGHAYRGVCGDGCRVIAGPGDYEVAGVFVTGVPTYHDDQEGKQRGKNVAFAITIDDVTVAHLGDLGHPLTAAMRESLGNVDVLLVPVGGRTTIDAAQAAPLIAQMEPAPKIVIPMHYRTGAPHSAAFDPVDRFLKEMGRAETAPQPRLNLTKANLPAETQVVVLEPTAARGGVGR